MKRKGKFQPSHINEIFTTSWNLKKLFCLLTNQENLIPNFPLFVSFKPSPNRRKIGVERNKNFTWCWIHCCIQVSGAEPQWIAEKTPVVMERNGEEYMYPRELMFFLEGWKWLGAWRKFWKVGEEGNSSFFLWRR